MSVVFWSMALYGLSAKQTDYENRLRSRFRGSFCMVRAQTGGKSARQSKFMC
jgi:hypothetical protein